MRRHLARSFARVTTLLAADLLAFLALRSAVRTVRDAGALGDGLAAAIAAVMPPGSLDWHFPAALLIGLAITGNYGWGDLRRDPVRLLAGVALGAAVSLWHALWQPGVGAVLVQFVGTTAGFWTILWLERSVMDSLVLRLLPRERQAERVVFVGDPHDPVGSRVQSKLVSSGDMVSLGWVSTDGATARDGTLGGAKDFWEIVRETGPDSVVLCGRLSDELFEAVVSASISAGCRLLAVPRYEGLAALRPGLVWQRGLPMIELTVPSLRAQQLLAKRVIDVLGSALGLIIVAPVFLLVAVAIKLDSTGPVFFRQERVGFGGRLFRILKFRTMREGVSDEAHKAFVQGQLTGDRSSADSVRGPDGVPVFKLVRDQRITRVGRLLRRTSLDELPQLINVLRGDMSLVGPRPPLPYEVERYEHWQYDRLGVPPGITGLWQVSGRSLLTYGEMCELDVAYVERWSLWLDFQILLRTVPVVLFNSGRAG